MNDLATVDRSRCQISRRRKSEQTHQRNGQLSTLARGGGNVPFSLHNESELLPARARATDRSHAATCVGGVHFSGRASVCIPNFVADLLMVGLKDLGLARFGGIRSSL